MMCYTLYPESLQMNIIIFPLSHCLLLGIFGGTPGAMDWPWKAGLPGSFVECPVEFSTKRASWELKFRYQRRG